MNLQKDKEYIKVKFLSNIIIEKIVEHGRAVVSKDEIQYSEFDFINFTCTHGLQMLFWDGKYFIFGHTLEDIFKEIEEFQKYNK